MPFWPAVSSQAAGPRRGGMACVAATGPVPAGAIALTGALAPTGVTGSRPARAGVAVGTDQSRSRATGRLRRQRYHRATVITMASTVARTIAKKPSATHCAAPMASAALDVAADRLKTTPLISAATR